MILKRHDIQWNTAEAPVPSTWSPMHHYSTEHGGIYDDTLAFITCPEGHTLRVSRQIHAIYSDGVVSPSWVCVTPSCTFHTYIQLEGWLEP